MKSTNQVIFEWLNPDACWHEYDPNRRAWIPKQGLVFTKCVSNERVNICIKCGKDAGIPLQVNDEPLVSTAINVPDYKNDLNAVREAELKAVEVFGRDEYIKALETECEAIALIEELGVISWGDLLYTMVLALAPVRAEAVRKLILEKKI